MGGATGTFTCSLPKVTTLNKFVSLTGALVTGVQAKLWLLEPSLLF